ncbi:MAG: hypothetical protein ACK41F_04695 [Fimbriimonadaceae bacterium]
MRALALALLALAATLAPADRLIAAPSGRKVTYGTVKFDAVWEGDGERCLQSTVSYGLTPALEVSLGGEYVDSRNALPTLDLAYTITDPVVNYVPGLAIGVQDAFGNTFLGRRFYVAVSYDVGMTGRYNGDTPLQLTLGAGTGGHNGAFVGVSIPWTSRFRLLAEHDATRITAGIEVRPADGLWLRMLARDRRSVWGLGWTARL